MSTRSRHKSAISITLDNDVLEFFSGKGRSGKINHILRLYLRSRLGDEEDSRFEDKSPRQRFAPAIAVVQDLFGHDSIEAKMMVAIMGAIE